MSFLGPFEHTTGKTWGGVQISPTTLQATAVLGGLFGLDHLLLRSPQTALMKFIINILSLGLWYWYDVLQVFQEMDFVKEYGYSFPIKGPVGLGAGIVGDTSGPGAAPKGTPNPWYFVAYMFLTLVPFGVSSFFAGDFQGGSAKFFLTFFVFTTVLGLLWTLYSIFYATFNTKSLITKGVDRFFPATLFLKPFGDSPNLVIPGVKKAEEIQEDANNIFNKIYNKIILKLLNLFPMLYNKVFGIVEKPVLEAVVSVTEPIVNSAQEIKEAATAPEAEKQVGGALNAAIMMAAQQQGGGETVSKALFLGSVVLIFVGSISLTYFRFWRAKKNRSSEHSNQDDIPPETGNDAPPGPRVF
jgi:hypothetical protein